MNRIDHLGYQKAIARPLSKIEVEEWVAAKKRLRARIAEVTAKFLTHRATEFINATHISRKVRHMGSKVRRKLQFGH